MSTESDESGLRSDTEIGRPRLLQRMHEAIRVRALQPSHGGGVRALDQAADLLSRQTPSGNHG